MLNFVTPYYSEKDSMHNLEHIKRIKKMTSILADHYYPRVDTDLINTSLYFHGIIHLNNGEETIRNFLKDHGIPEEDIERVIKTAWDSQKDASTNEVSTIEGKIVHDAHLLEGGRTFMVIKTFCTGATLGNSIQQSIDWLENKVLGKFQCILPESQELYELKEAYARLFLADLKSHL